MFTVNVGLMFQSSAGCNQELIVHLPHPSHQGQIMSQNPEHEESCQHPEYLCID